MSALAVARGGLRVNPASPSAPWADMQSPWCLKGQQSRRVYQSQVLEKVHVIRDAGRLVIQFTCPSDGARIEPIRQAHNSSRVSQRFDGKFESEESTSIEKSKKLGNGKLGSANKSSRTHWPLESSSLQSCVGKPKSFPRILDLIRLRLVLSKVPPVVDIYSYKTFRRTPNPC